jgi:hypothetical protein
LLLLLLLPWHCSCILQHGCMTSSTFIVTGLAALAITAKTLMLWQHV